MAVQDLNRAFVEQHLNQVQSAEYELVLLGDDTMNHDKSDRPFTENLIANFSFERAQAISSTN